MYQLIFNMPILPTEWRQNTLSITIIKIPLQEKRDKIKSESNSGVDGASDAIVESNRVRAGLSNRKTEQVPGHT